MSAASPFLEPTGESPGGEEPPPLVVASNRLPVRWDASQERWVRSSGGLVAALEPVVRRTGGVWVGWCDGPQPPPRHDIELQPIPLAPSEVDDYYAGFANATLWPALHDAIEPVEFQPRWWNSYRAVNSRFAAAIARTAPMGAAVWIHDYHLLLVPRMLRRLRSDVRIGFFLHTPWPTLSVASEVPRIDELVDGIAAADVIGFQRGRDEARFRALRSTICRDAVPPVNTSVLPISIDWAQWSELANDPAVHASAHRVRSSLGDRRRLLLGVDRMDYSKGIPQRLDALMQLFEHGRVAPRHVRLLQVAVPTRQSIPAYRRLREDVVSRVRHLNERFGAPGDPGVELREDSAPPRELAALYLAADVALVTPRRDGMNLVAKEFCAVQGADRPGVLVLGRGAGAADELSDAVLVDGSDPASIADGIERALTLPPLARRAMADRLRDVVRAWDLGRWTESFLRQLAEVEVSARRGGVPGAGFVP